MDTTILDMMSKPELINLIVFLLKNKIVQPNFQPQMVAHPQEMQMAQPTFHNIHQQMHPHQTLHNVQSTMVAQPTFHNIQQQSILHNVQLQEETQDIALRQLFVRDIAFTTTNEMLAYAYSKYGNVESARIQFERTHNSNHMRSRGFGFVTFERAEDANKATIEKHLMIDGRLTECHLAVNGKYTRPINKHNRF